MRMHLFVSCLMVSLLGVGCGYHYYSEPLQPVESDNTAMNVADDGSVIFTQDRLEVRLKPVHGHQNALFGLQGSDSPHAPSRQ